MGKLFFSVCALIAVCGSSFADDGFRSDLRLSCYDSWGDFVHDIGISKVSEDGDYAMRITRLKVPMTKMARSVVANQTDLVFRVEESAVYVYVPNSLMQGTANKGEVTFSSETFKQVLPCVRVGN